MKIIEEFTFGGDKKLLLTDSFPRIIPRIIYGTGSKVSLVIAGRLYSGRLLMATTHPHWTVEIAVIANTEELLIGKRIYRIWDDKG